MGEDADGSGPRPMYGRATIMLETMSKSATLLMLLATALAVAAALTVGRVQRERLHTVEFEDVRCPLGSVTQDSAGCVVLPNGNETVWRGLSVNRDQLDTLASVALKATNFTGRRKMHVPFAFSVTVRGLVRQRTANWTAAAFPPGPSENVARTRGHTAVDCWPDFPCSSSTLLEVPSPATGFWAYAVEVWLSVPTTSIAAATRVEVATREFAARETAAYIRLGLFIATCFVGGSWFALMRSLRQPWSRWLPERKWVSCQLLALAVWQDPVQVLLLRTRHYWRVTELSLVVLETLGVASVMLLWLLLVAGLLLKRHRPLQFYAPRFLLCAAYSACTVASEVRRVEHGADEWTVALSAAAFGLLLAWVFLLLASIVRVTKRLRSLPYLSTRFQQLSFRVFVLMASMILTYWCVSLVVSGSVDRYYHNGRYPDLADLNPARDTYQPLARVILFSAYLYLVAFMYLPPRATRRALGRFHALTTRNGFVRYERDLPPPAVAPEGVFCLETALRLIEFSWQAYYDPPRCPSEHGAGPMNLRQYGYRLAASVVDPAMDTHCFVAVSGDGARRGWARGGRWDRVDLTVVGGRAGEAVAEGGEAPRVGEDEDEEKEVGVEKGEAEEKEEEEEIVLFFRGTVSAQNIRVDARASRETADFSLPDMWGGTVRALQHAMRRPGGGGAGASPAAVDEEEGVEGGVGGGARPPDAADDKVIARLYGPEEEEEEAEEAAAAAAAGEDIGTECGEEEGEGGGSGEGGYSGQDSPGATSPRPPTPPAPVEGGRGDAEPSRRRQRSLSSGHVEGLIRAGETGLAGHGRGERRHGEGDRGGRHVSGDSAASRDHVDWLGGVAEEEEEERKGHAASRGWLFRAPSLPGLLRGRSDSDGGGDSPMGLGTAPTDLLGLGRGQWGGGKGATLRAGGSARFSGQPSRAEEADAARSGVESGGAPWTGSAQDAAFDGTGDNRSATLAARRALSGLDRGAVAAVRAPRISGAQLGAKSRSQPWWRRSAGHRRGGGAAARGLDEPLLGAGGEEGQRGAGSARADHARHRGARDVGQTVGAAAEAAAGAFLRPLATIERLFPHRVHAGFWQAYQRVRIPLLRQVKQVLAQSEARRHRLAITGHSLGGALATLAALDVAQVFDVPVVMYNFGSPRVGNHGFAAQYNRMVPQSFRCTFEGDFVAGLPKFYRMYKHVGREVVLDRAGNLIVDPSFVETLFHVHSKRRLASHLMTAYRRGLQSSKDNAQWHTAPGEAGGSDPRAESR